MPSTSSAAPRVIAIDGPAGAGKTTAARELARELGMTLLDTGAIYRTLALVARRRGVSWDDEAGLAALTQDFPLEFRAPAEGSQVQRVFFGGEELTADIRTPFVSEGASRVSVHAKVRESLLALQRALPARSGRGCVAEGRDMGTVVFPDAPLKFFVTASPPARARRRWLELKARGTSVTLEQVADEMRRRDERDSQRAVAPLRPAPDALLLDTSDMDADAVLAFLLEQVDASGFRP
jgi:cytidylate kinase